MDPDAELRSGLSQRLIPRVAHHAFPVVIHVHEAALVEAADRHQVRQQIEHPRQALLARPQRLLHAPALGDIVRPPEDVFALPEGHDPRRDLHDDEIAVLAPQPDLAAARLVPPDNVPVQLFPVLRVFPQADFQAGAADDLCLAETERALPGFIDLHVLPAGIAGHGKRLGRQRKEAGESLLAFPQGLFRLLADGDVLEGADEAHQLLTFHDRGDVKPGPGNAAVPAVMASLAGKRLALGDGGAPLLLVLAKVLRMQPLRDAPAGQLGLGNAGDLESAPRIVDRLAGGIGYEYAQHRAFADGAEALLGGMQVVFGALQRSDVMALRHQIDHLAGVIADRRKEEVEVVEAAVSAGVVGFEAVMAARGNPADRLLQPLLLLRIMRPPWRLPVGLADHVLELDAGALERRAIDIDHRAVRLQQADHAARGIDNGAIALFVAGASSLGARRPSASRSSAAFSRCASKCSLRCVTTSSTMPIARLMTGP